MTKKRRTYLPRIVGDMRALPAGFIAPCLPTKTDKLPSGDGWLHEIKHDEFRGDCPQERRAGEALQPPWQ
jgi:ATP-dependent DNA ligase